MKITDILRYIGQPSKVLSLLIEIRLIFALLELILFRKHKDCRVFTQKWSGC